MWSRDYSSGGQRLDDSLQAAGCSLQACLAQGADAGCEAREPEGPAACRLQPVARVNRQFSAFGTASVNGAIAASNASPPLVTI
jgi:hypothetical protein